MRALCPSCGFHHEVVRVLDAEQGETGKDIYQVAPLETCDRSWLSDGEIFEATARFGREAIVEDDDDV